MRTLLARLQLIMTNVFYVCLGPFTSGRNRRRYTIGAQDIMKNIHFMKKILGNSSYTVCGFRFPMVSSYDPTKRRGWELYDDSEYDFGYTAQWERLIKLPLLLAWLARNSDVFIYFGSHGFLVEESRALEYRFLKRRGKKLVAIFVGCDIRQREQSHQFFTTLRHDYMCSYCHLECSAIEKRARAQAALRDCDAVLSSRDQPGFLWDQYIPIDGLSFPIVDVSEYQYRFDQDFTSGPVVVHAPTNAVYKGTAFVRQAIARLQEEGYAFEYVELLGMPNVVVREQLKRSHVVLNQFFGTVPGLFGVEAMASGNAVLGSSFLGLNPDLPASIPIIPTTGHQVYENLRQLILEPQRIAPLAEAGRRYVEEYHDCRTAGVRLAETIEGAIRSPRQSHPLRPAVFPMEVRPGPQSSRS